MRDSKYGKPARLSSNGPQPSPFFSCLFAIALAGLLLVLSARAEDPAAEAADSRADQFLVKDCTGPAAGKTLCYFCRYAGRPVVALFVRDLSDDVAGFIQRIDEAVGAHEGRRLAAFVVLVGSDTQDSETQLKLIAKRLRIRRTPLTIYRDKADILSEVFRLQSDAAVNAVAWRRGEVALHRAFPNDRLKRADTDGFLTAVERWLQD